MHRPSRSPGQRFRFEQYLPYLHQRGYLCDISYIINEADDRVIYSRSNYVPKAYIFGKSVIHRMSDVINAHKYDIIFIFREALMINTPIFEIMLSYTGAKMVFDFDDAIWLQGVSAGNAKLAWLRSGPAKTPAILRRMDLVFAGNEYLAAYARQFNSEVHIIPTTVNTETHRPVQKRKKDSICVGWSGSQSTIQYILPMMPLFEKLKLIFGDRVKFKVLGDGGFRYNNLDIIGVPWSAETEVSDTAELDIGLMPLPDDEWSRGKCGFKALLYMAFAIPPVISPVGVNGQIVDHGVNGFFASSEGDWLNYTSQLISSPTLRDEIGRHARATVVERYSLASQRDRYVALLDSLCGRPSAP
jgi:glycosyltransferase involved in cell wall biosynthesis